MQETQLNGESLDIVSENVSKLKQLFPEILTEDKIDFDKLLTILGNYIDEDYERYNFTWKGKKDSLIRSQTPSTWTLRPCKEESKQWDTTQNLFIEGDNLQVLKLLQKSYYRKVKMIYIDPPYNTGNEFVYSDDFKDDRQYYLEITGQTDSEGLKISTNTDTGGRYHTNWLNMIYPRLRLARNLLKDDGVIFISIDDNEYANLRKICDEIFGEENFVATVIWEKVHTRKNSAKYFSVSHDYILVFAKYKDQWKRNLIPRENTNDYKNPDNDPKGPWKSDPIYANNPYSADYTITKPNGVKLSKPEGKFWRFSESNIKKFIDENKIIWGKGDSYPLVKRYLSEVQDGLVPVTLFDKEYAGHNSTANSELKNLFGINNILDYPKPSLLIRRLMEISTNPYKNDIILDFFSGSSSTAHAVFNINFDDNGNRKFIMVQLPEPTTEKDEAYKAGYKNICEIGKERIRRAGDQCSSEINGDSQTSFDPQPNLSDNKLDVGFKVFKIDSSNLNRWDPDYANIEQTLLDSVENLVPGRSKLDLIYEIMLKYGIDLTLPIEEYPFKDMKTIYSIGFGALIICLEDNITLDISSEILKIKDKLSPEITRVVFKDNGFATDSDKTNVKETLQTHGIDEFVTI